MQTGCFKHIFTWLWSFFNLTWFTEDLYSRRLNLNWHSNTFS